MSKNAILVDHTTASAELARELDAAAKAKSIGFLDAPVSGGQAGAESGKLTVMVGGDATSFARAEPVMAHYGRAVTHMGPAGNGQLTKMVNQILIAGLVQGLSEGLNFAVHAGLDARKAAEVISKARRKAGSSRTAIRPCSTANSISALPSIGCVRICRSAWPKRAATNRRCRSLRSSINSTSGCKSVAAAVGIHRACSIFWPSREHPA